MDKKVDSFDDIAEDSNKGKITRHEKNIRTSLAGLSAMLGQDFIPEIKPHWKELQSEEEKESRLKAAELKRQRKAEKKARLNQSTNKGKIKK